MMTQSANSLYNLLLGNFDLVHLAPNSMLLESERLQILETMLNTPPTFDLAPYPPCWGKAFENYLTLDEYLSPEPNDEIFAGLCTPINERVQTFIESLGLKTEVLVDPKSNRPYTIGDFRSSVISANDSILHIDDLAIDGSVKSDFVLPRPLQGKDYVQLSLLICLNEPQGEAFLRIYDRRYTKDDDCFRLENGWQFSDEAVKNAKYVDFKPKAGDTFIMPNQFFHDVVGGKTDDKWALYSLYLLHIPGEQQVFLYI